MLFRSSLGSPRSPSDEIYIGVIYIEMYIEIIVEMVVAIAGAFLHPGQLVHIHKD